MTYISWFSDIGLYLEDYFMYKAVTLAGGIREPLLTCSSFIALWGGIPPSVLKGVLWGSLLLRKGAWFCFGVHQRFAKLETVDRGKNV